MTLAFIGFCIGAAAIAVNSFIVILRRIKKHPLSDAETFLYVAGALMAASCLAVFIMA